MLVNYDSSTTFRPLIFLKLTLVVTALIVYTLQQFPRFSSCGNNWFKKKFGFKTPSTHRTQTTSFEVGERLTGDTVFAGVRSFLFIAEFRLCSHL